MIIAQIIFWIFFIFLPMYLVYLYRFFKKHPVFRIEESKVDGKTKFCLQEKLPVMFPMYLGGWDDIAEYSTLKEAMDKKKQILEDRNYGVKYHN